MRADNPAVLTVDAGDFAQLDNPRVPGGWQLSEKTAETLGQIGCDAWTPGERELLHGPERLATLVTDFGIPVVSANIQRGGRRLFPEKVIKTVGGIKIGITGVTGPEVLLDTKAALQSVAGAADAWELTDPIRALIPVVTSLHKSCDLVVVLAHLAPAEARHLVESVAGIDVVVIGHMPGSGYDGERYGASWVIRTGQRGQLVARLDLVTAGGAVTGATGTFVDLTPVMPGDANLQTKLSLFEATIKALREKP